MNSENDYEAMLLFRGNQWHKGLSPEEVQTVMEKWTAWFDRLSEQGKIVSGHPLANEGKIISGKQGKTVADGPFAESKEAIGGYFFLKVADMDEAIEIGKECPALEYGLTVEVRPVTVCCAVAQEVNRALAEAAIA